MGRPSGTARVHGTQRSPRWCQLHTPSATLMCLATSSWLCPAHSCGPAEIAGEYSSLHMNPAKRTAAACQHNQDAMKRTCCVQHLIAAQGTQQTVTASTDKCRSYVMSSAGHCCAAQDTSHHGPPYAKHCEPPAPAESFQLQPPVVTRHAPLSSRSAQSLTCALQYQWQSDKLQCLPPCTGL